MRQQLLQGNVRVLQSRSRSLVGRRRQKTVDSRPQPSALLRSLRKPHLCHIPSTCRHSHNSLLDIRNQIPKRNQYLVLSCQPDKLYSVSSQSCSNTVLEGIEGKRIDRPPPGRNLHRTPTVPPCLSHCNCGQGGTVGTPSGRSCSRRFQLCKAHTLPHLQFRARKAGIRRFW